VLFSAVFYSAVFRRGDSLKDPLGHAIEIH